MGVTEYIRKAIKMDGSLRAEFVEDSAFDAVWDFFLNFVQLKLFYLLK
jgi:hypothetical protein